MRIGVLGAPHRAEVGGGYTFTKLIEDAVAQLDSLHDILIMDYERAIVGIGERTDGIPGHYHSEIEYFLNNYIKSNKIDFVWFISPLGIPTALDVPYAITVWDLAHKYYPYLPEIRNGWTAENRDLYYWPMLNNAAFVVVGTNFGAQEVHEFYRVPSSKIHCIPLPTPRMELNSDVNISFKKPYLLYPAQFWPHKNHAHAVKAISILKHDKLADVDLILVGSDQGNENHIRALVEQHDVRDKVHFLGFVERDMLSRLYVDAAALLFLSLFGPDNLPPLEAFSCGCPVIASDTPGHREQLHDAALFVDPFDDYSIALAIARMLNDDDLRRDLCNRGEFLASDRTITRYLKDANTLFDKFAKVRECWL